MCGIINLIRGICTFFDDKLKKALNEEIAKSSPFAFLLIERGDQVLQQLELLLNKNLRESNYCIRYEDDITLKTNFIII